MITWIKNVIHDIFGEDECDDCGDCCGGCSAEPSDVVQCTIYLFNGDTIELSHAVKEPGTYTEFSQLTAWFGRAARMNNHDSVYEFKHDYGSILLRFSDIRRIEVDGEHKRQ